MNIQLFRLDDRLIHGQVVLGWANNLHTRQIVLCDDNVAQSDWEKELYLSVVPDNMQARILGVDETLRLLQSDEDLSATIFLTGSPQVVAELQKKGASLPKVNVGGLHFRDGRKRYLAYLYLSDEECVICKDLMANGLEMYCQDVPDAQKIDLSRLLADIN